MIDTPLPELENERLAELYAFNILDTPPDQDFSDIVELASMICGTPISHISLIDRERSWHKARKGLQEQELPRNLSFCTHTVCGSIPIIVPDATNDERFASNPFVLEAPAIRFYAGFPLVTTGGHSIGTLCVVDTIPRALNQQQLNALDILSKQVVKLLNERIRSQNLSLSAILEQKRNVKLQQLIDTQRRIMAILGHDTRGPLFYINWMIRTMMNSNMREYDLENNFQVISNQLDSTLIMIEDLLDWSRVNILNATGNEDIFAVRDMVDELFEPVQMLAEKKSIQLENEVSETLVGRRHERIIRFALRNIILNAIKFSRQGTIVVNASVDRQWFRLSVTDEGIGMSEQQLQEILKGESKSTRGTENEQGSGLGFMLIRDFLQQVNGKLEIDSTPGKGTSVMLYLPA
jgi:signal transduction histidine kinase